MNIEPNTVVAITGAAGGIGRALATGLAERGCRLALADRDAVGVAETARLCEEAGAACSMHVVDVGNQAQVFEFAEAAKTWHGGIDILINNAGVAVQGDFEEVSLEDFRWLMNINLYGVVSGCKAFLPHLKGRKQAVIVNVSSAFGLVALPGQAAYSASKFAVRGFSEALRHELEETAPHVRVMCVFPCAVKTNIAKSAKPHASMSTQEHASNAAEFEQIATMTAAEAASQMIRAIEGTKTRVLVGPGVKFLDFLQRLLPETYMAIIRRGMKKYETDAGKVVQLEEPVVVEFKRAA